MFWRFNSLAATFMPRTHLPALVLLLPLGGCFGGSLDATVNEDRTFQAKAEFRIAGNAYAEMSDDQKPCKLLAPASTEINNDITLTRHGGVPTEEDIVCRYEISGTLDHLMRNFENRSSDNSPSPQLTEENGLFALSIPLSSGKAFDPDQPLGQMIIASTRGYSIKLKVTAPSIVSTNGTMSEDGTFAEIALPTAIWLKSGDPDLSFDVSFKLKQ